MVTTRRPKSTRLTAASAIITQPLYSRVNDEANANPQKSNAAIAVVFAVLGLAMFDVIEIDLTRFQGGVGGTPSRRGSYMAAAGMGIGSHTHNHVICAAQKEEVVREEMAASKILIERETDRSCRHFCYPNGHFPGSGNEATDRLASETGYQSVLYMMAAPNLVDRRHAQLAVLREAEKQYESSTGERIVNDDL